MVAQTQTDSDRIETVEIAAEELIDMLGSELAQRIGNDADSELVLLRPVGSGTVRYLEQAESEAAETDSGTIPVLILLDLNGNLKDEITFIDENGDIQSASLEIR